MFLFAQFKKRGNALYKFSLWSRASPLFDIAEVPIGNSKMLGGITEIQFGLFSSCTDKSPKGHISLPLCGWFAWLRTPYLYYNSYECSMQELKKVEG